MRGPWSWPSGRSRWRGRGAKSWTTSGHSGWRGCRAAAGAVSELVAGGSVGGELLAAAGPDLHLATRRGVVVLDTRLMAGWEIVPAGGDDEVTLPVREFGQTAGVQDGLF